MTQTAVDNSTASRAAPAGANPLETADQEAVVEHIELPPSLVWDPDSKRKGRYGGFFGAKDLGFDRFDIPNAPQDSKEWLFRDNGDKEIEGWHLPEKVRFAFVAIGRLYHVEKANMSFERDGRDALTPSFEAIAFCNQIFDHEREYPLVKNLSKGGPALVKVALKGVPAVKVAQYIMTPDILDPLNRMTEFWHSEARRKKEAGEIDEARLARILASKATPSMLWVPIHANYQYRMGEDAKKTTVGAVPKTDEKIETEGRSRPTYKSLWPQVPTPLLVKPDQQGGLLVTGEIYEFCKKYRPQFTELLLARAERWGIYPNYGVGNQPSGPYSRESVAESRGAGGGDQAES